MSSEMARITTQIVSAFVGNNAVIPDAVPSLIQTVYRTLSMLGQVPAGGVELVPAVPVKKSVFGSHLVCLEDGKKLKTLKRHLQTAYGLTPDEYRTKWSLPSSYPMVAPDYAARRSQLARDYGLGRKPAVSDPAVQQVSEAKRRRKVT